MYIFGMRIHDMWIDLSSAAINWAWRVKDLPFQHTRKWRFGECAFHMFDNGEIGAKVLQTVANHDVFVVILSILA